MDGIDAALLLTDGADIAEPMGVLSVPYDDKLRAALRAAVARAEFLPGVDALERTMTLAHATVVGALLRQEELAPDAVRVIGFHGHTLLHRPEAGVTWQIGDGAPRSMPGAKARRWPRSFTPYWRANWPSRSRCSTSAASPM
jgi:anhydro-N-acetylmuramic acid kinase